LEARSINILVTGCAGFIGSHIVERLLLYGHEVIGIDNYDSYYDPQIKRRNVAPFIADDNFISIEGDIRDDELICKILENIDCIFHEAAQAGVRASVEDPMKSHEINATGTLKLLKATLDSDVKTFVYASSSSVYGKVRYLPFDEEHPKSPVSPYGISKLIAEYYCNIFYELYGLKTTSLRYFTVYGPRMRPDLAINIFTQCALRNRTIEIFGDGLRTRDFTFIDDVVDANILAMNNKRGVYNIGSGNSISIRDLADHIIRLTKSSSKLKFLSPAKGDSEHTMACIKKAEDRLGWKPKVDINKGLERYIMWATKERNDD